MLIERASNPLLMGYKRSDGIGIPATIYLKIRAWCSSSCHCDAVKGKGLCLAFIIILLREDKQRKTSTRRRKEEKKRKRSRRC